MKRTHDSLINVHREIFPVLKLNLIKGLFEVRKISEKLHLAMIIITAA